MFRTQDGESQGNRIRTTILSVIGVIAVIAIIFGVIFGTRFRMGNNSKKLVSGVYYSNWSVYGAKHFPEDMDSDHLSHVFYAFMKIDSQTGEVGYSDQWADIDMPVGDADGALGLIANLKKRKRNLKVVMSIGGWGTADQFSQVTRDEAKLTKFVDTAIKLVEKHKFDGIDIDWEFPANDQEGYQLVSLLNRLRAALTDLRAGLILTIASPASEYHSKYIDFGAIDQVITYWNVMAYDFAASTFSQKIGYHSNMYGHNGDTDLNCDAIIQFYSRLVDTLKILMGMPLYGRQYYKPSEPKIGSLFSRENPYGSDTIDYHLIDRGMEQFDHEKVAAHAYDSQKDVFITYDSPESTNHKASYVLNKGLAGGFWWESKGESKEEDRRLVKKFVDNLGGTEVLESSENWV